MLDSIKGLGFTCVLTSLVRSLGVQDRVELRTDGFELLLMGMGDSFPVLELDDACLGGASLYRFEKLLEAAVSLRLPLNAGPNSLSF
jgi:hypothetical protein